MARRRPKRKWRTIGVPCPDCQQEIRVGLTQGPDGDIQLEGWAWPCGHRHLASDIRRLVEEKLTPQQDYTVEQARAAADAYRDYRELEAGVHAILTGIGRQIREAPDSHASSGPFGVARSPNA